MSTKEKVVNIINMLPDDVLLGLLDYVEYLAYQENQKYNADLDEAVAEMEEMEKNPHLYKGYDNVDEMMKEILK